MELEFRGVVGSQRRITIPRIYVVASGLLEGELVSVGLSESATKEESSFLAHVQRGFRIQIPKTEYEVMELSEGEIVDVEIERVKEPLEV